MNKSDGIARVLILVTLFAISSGEKGDGFCSRGMLVALKNEPVTLTGN
jgi:hypothetical protein